MGRIEFLVLLAVLSTGACSTFEPTVVYVDAVASSSAADKKDYYLYSAERGHTAYERRRHEKFARLIDEELQSAGFIKKPTLEEAQVVVVFNYGVGHDREGTLWRRTSFVEIAAFDWQAVSEAGAKNAIWRTQIYLDGSDGGIGRNVPLLVSVAGPYLATTSADAVEVLAD
jgi:hypothetical protein